MFLSRMVLLAMVPVCLAQGDLFEAKVRPVLLARCSSCHGTSVQMAGKQFTTREGMHRSGSVVAGDVDGSSLIQAVRYEGKVKMPPAGKLADSEIAALEKWVREGAVWPEGPRGEGASA